MIRDTIQNRQMIGMFLLQPGWQDDYYGNPPIHSVGCAGELIHLEELPEGKFDIVLRGITRVRALETVQEHPYRRVKVHVLPEKISVNDSTVSAMKKKLLKNFRLYSTYAENSTDAFDLESDFIQIVNLIISTLQLDLDEKRGLLEEDDVYQRALAVEDHLSAAVSVLKLTSGFSHLRPSDPNVN
jgi:uncharacterized protein